MHPDDIGMATEGDMFHNRRKPNIIIRNAIQLLSRLPARDRFENQNQPALNGLIDDPEAARASAGRLQEMRIGRVFPGHADSFRMDELELSVEKTRKRIRVNPPLTCHL